MTLVHVRNFWSATPIFCLTREMASGDDFQGLALKGVTKLDQRRSK